MTNIKVAVRIRPLSERELSQRGTLPVVKAEIKNVVTVTNIKVAENNAGDSRDRIRRFAFDYCFGPTTTQTEVYDVIGNDVMSAVTSKYNLCVLAYGQSASGKTYTMMGSQKNPGLTQRICKGLFKQWEKCNQTIRVTASFLEIYNERVQDLLGLRRPGEEPAVSLKVREHPKTGPYVQGLTEHEVKNADELLELVRRGDGARSVAATLSNRQSSRSHSVLTVACTDGNSSSNYIPTSGSGHLFNKSAATRLYLVDLAGSERANSCVQDNARRLKEGANINRSLVALGNVISALAENNLDKVKSSWKRYVPYRDSVLTWLLKDTLGGNSKTIMIATVSPSSSCYSETVNTLRFGQRAKKIVNQPVINEDPNTRIIRELQEEVARLKKLLTEHQISENPVESNVETKSDTTEATNDDNRIKIKEVTDSATITDEYDCVSPLEEVTSNRYEAKAEVGCNISGVVIKTDTLIPFMNVSSSVLPTTESNLRRTFSDYELHTLNSFIRPKFGSQETLTSSVINCNAKRESGTSGVSGSRVRLHSCTEKSLDSEKCSLSDTTFSDSKTPPKLNTSRGSTGSLTILSQAQKPQPTTSTAAPVKEAIKKHNIEKRSQIVSSVTERLYSAAKLKRKDNTFDTSHRSSSSSVTSEMSICSNERNRLHDLTLRALNASRRYRKKPILVMNETQTDPERVVRVKEVATDVPYDILSAVQLAKDVSTQIVVSHNHIAVGSDNSVTFDCQEQVNPAQPKTLIVTRSCGNMTVECNEQQTKDGGNEVMSTSFPQTNPYSFTKYINYNQRKSNIKTISFAIPQYEPVYTTSVNINLNCNVTELRNGDDSLSDDSLDGGQMQTGDNYQIVSLPTPDLLSNHNSLENSSTVINDDKNMVPSTTDNTNVLENICHANETSITDDFKNVECIHIPRNEFHYADTIFETSACNGIVTTTCISTIQFNPESDFSDEEEDFSLPRSTGCRLENTKSWPEFKNMILGKNKNMHPYNIDLNAFYKKDDSEKSSHKKTNKNVTWADSVTENSLEKCVPEDEPYVKPILKSCKKTCEVENDELSENFENSCEDNACKDNKDLTLAMSNFLKEVSSLISNLNTATKYFHECNEEEKFYECSVTVNNVESILTDTFKTDLIEKTLPTDICKIEKSVQTEQNRITNTIEESTNTDRCSSIEILNNKWEKSLEESCLKLEYLTQNNCQSLRKSNKDNPLNLSDSDVSFSSVESIEASTSKSFNENKTNIEHKKTNLKRYEPSTNLNKYNGSYTFSNFKSPREYLQTLMNARRQVIEQSRELLAMSENNDINS